MNPIPFLIQLENIHFCYESVRSVLAGVDFFLKDGERVGLIGANGSGKTTLLHLLVGLIKPSSGHVIVFGRERKEEKDFIHVRRKMGLLFQNAEDQLFCPTVAEDVAFGPFNLGKHRDEVERIVKDTLAAVGLEGFEERITYRLSGGEKRLVSLAAVLAMQPKVLLLDEPTYGLDEESEHRILDILSALPMSMIAVSHHRDFLNQITDRQVWLKAGKIVPITV